MFAQDEWPDVYPPGIGRGPGITTAPISRTELNTRDGYISTEPNCRTDFTNEKAPIFTHSVFLSRSRV